jgi:hypothetical protein
MVFSMPRVHTGRNAYCSSGFVLDTQKQMRVPGQPYIIANKTHAVVTIAPKSSSKAGKAF